MSRTTTGWFQVFPSIALNRASSVNLSGVAGKRQLTFLGDHEPQILIGQQYHLPLAVATAFPLALTVLEFDGGENTAVETKACPL